MAEYEIVWCCHATEPVNPTTAPLDAIQAVFMDLGPAVTFHGSDGGTNPLSGEADWSWFVTSEDVSAVESLTAAVQNLLYPAGPPAENAVEAVNLTAREQQREQVQEQIIAAYEDVLHRLIDLLIERNILDYDRDLIVRGPDPNGTWWGDYKVEIPSARMRMHIGVDLRMGPPMLPHPRSALPVVWGAQIETNVGAPSVHRQASSTIEIVLRSQDIDGLLRTAADLAVLHTAATGGAAQSRPVAAGRSGMHRQGRP